MMEGLKGGWDLAWFKSYLFMGCHSGLDLSKYWVKKCDDLAEAYPTDGANFCSIWSRTEAGSKAPSTITATSGRNGNCLQSVTMATPGKTTKRIRILHVVGGMERAGVETWLMNVLRHIDRERFSMDFLVHTTHTCSFDDEIRSLGSKLIPCLHPSRPWLYAQNLMHTLDKEGPYDVIHSHVHLFSGFVMRLAKRAGVPFVSLTATTSWPKRKGDLVLLAVPTDP